MFILQRLNFNTSKIFVLYGNRLKQAETACRFRPLKPDFGFVFRILYLFRCQTVVFSFQYRTCRFVIRVVWRQRSAQTLRAFCPNAKTVWAKRACVYLYMAENENDSEMLREWRIFSQTLLLLKTTDSRASETGRF